VGKSNTDIFREIARRCTIDVAISLSGRELTNGRGSVINHAEIGKTYRSPFRSDQNPSFSFYNGKSGWVRWKDFGTGESGDLIQLVAKGRGILRPEAAKLIDQEMHLNLWTEPRPKTNRESNFKPRTKTNRDLESIQKQVGLAGDNEWLRIAPSLRDQPTNPCATSPIPMSDKESIRWRERTFFSLGTRTPVHCFVTYSTTIIPRIIRQCAGKVQRKG